MSAAVTRSTAPRSERRAVRRRLRASGRGSRADAASDRRTARDAASGRTRGPSRRKCRRRRPSRRSDCRGRAPALRVAVEASSASRACTCSTSCPASRSDFKHLLVARHELSLRHARRATPSPRCRRETRTCFAASSHRSRTQRSSNLPGVVRGQRRRRARRVLRPTADRSSAASETHCRCRGSACRRREIRASVSARWCWIWLPRMRPAAMSSP